MARRTYGQLCGLAQALDLVGERWTLLIVRDLAQRPRRFGELHDGLAGIGTGLLSARLAHLEGAGVVERHAAPDRSRGVEYRLTAHGDALWAAVQPLARWGLSAFPDEPRPADRFEPEWVLGTLRVLFRPERADGVDECYRFVIDGRPLWADVRGRELEVGSGDPPREPAFTLTADVATFAGVGAGRVRVPDAMRDGRAGVEGDPAAGLRALELFSAASTDREGAGVSD